MGLYESITPTEFIKSSSKVSEWVRLLNKVSTEIINRETIYETTVDYYEDEKGERNSTLLANTYKFDDADFSAGKNYMVIYGGVVLDPEDYTLSGSTLTLVTNPPLAEHGLRIRIIYLGMVNL